MDKLKKYIHLHRQEFDVHEPAEGHFDRFKAKLMAQKPVKKVNLFLVASAAAVAGIFLTASLSLLINFNSFVNFGGTDLASNGLPSEIEQIDEYYRFRVNQKQQIITQMISDETSPMKNEISSTIADFDSNYKSLRNDISITPRQDRAAYVLTLYYQAQLEAMEQIIVRLENINMMNQ